MQMWVSTGKVDLGLDSVDDSMTIWAKGEDGMEQGALPWRSLGMRQWGVPATVSSPILVLL